MAMAVAQAMPAQQMQMMAVQCPPDSGPGQQIVVNANGQQMSVVVPDGVEPGGQFQIQVPAAQPVMAATVAGGAGMAMQTQNPMAGGMGIQAGLQAGCERLAPFGDLFIQQQIEMMEMFTGFEGANHYNIFGFVPGVGQTQLFCAAEESGCCARQCCEAAHGFEMKVFENAQQPILNVVRPLRCTTPHCCCYLQEVSIYEGNGSPENGGVF